MLQGLGSNSLRAHGALLAREGMQDGGLYVVQLLLQGCWAVNEFIMGLCALGALLQREHFQDGGLSEVQLLLDARSVTRHQLRHLVQQVIDHPLR